MVCVVVVGHVAAAVGGGIAGVGIVALAFGVPFGRRSIKHDLQFLSVAFFLLFFEKEKNNFGEKTKRLKSIN